VISKNADFNKDRESDDCEQDKLPPKLDQQAEADQIEPPIFFSVRHFHDRAPWSRRPVLSMSGARRVVVSRQPHRTRLIAQSRHFQS
jgi:hypothetical protein